MDRSNYSIDSYYLELKSVSKLFGGELALNNVGLSLNKGEFLSLLGPSGSGKTTLLRMLAGLLDVSSGNILVNNNELTNIPANKRNFGMVFQNYALFPHLTVFENVAYGLKARKVDKKIIKEKVETYL
ncbi:ATP-binding cassette domain-containing protein, partial [Butyricicoccus sp. 1XD8-22]